jgi:hypothetical protein
MKNSITFNQEVFGNIFKRKKQVERRLKGIQHYLERVDSARHTIQEKELQNEYNHILFQEEILWYQKSREKWKKFGDKNSSFFHAQTIIRRKKIESIDFSSLMVLGQLIAPFSKKKLKSISRTSLPTTNLTITVLSLPTTNQP